MNRKRKKSSARNGERCVPKNFTEGAEAIAIGSGEGKLREESAGMNQDATI
jgi:hypothetical protein